MCDWPEQAFQGPGSGARRVGEPVLEGRPERAESHAGLPLQRAVPVRRGRAERGPPLRDQAPLSSIDARKPHRGPAGRQSTARGACRTHRGRIRRRGRDAYRGEPPHRRYAAALAELRALRDAYALPGPSL
ncbi:hypothetical protein GCM10027074_32090 [Streptomyces deserti]